MSNLRSQRQMVVEDRTGSNPSATAHRQGAISGRSGRSRCQARSCGVWHDAAVRVTYDPEADAAYIYLTEEQLKPGRDSIPVGTPEGTQAMVVMDWKDGKIIGLEVLDASALLH